MSADNLFWYYISEDIKRVYKMKAPTEWSTEDIKNFQAIMVREIVPILEREPELQITFGAKKKGLYNSKFYTPPSAKTFQRIFISNESSGKDKTKDQFAMVFGAKNHNDYIVSKGLHVSVNEESSNQENKLVFEDTLLNYLKETTTFFKSITLQDIYQADIHLSKNIKNSDFTSKTHDTVDNKKYELLNEEQKNLGIRLPFKLASFYLMQQEFNSISIQADFQGKYGTLSMDDFFITPSYIVENELKNRESLLKFEKESSSTKIEKLKARYFQNFLPHEYISGNLLAGFNRVLITGNPGVGKSTYARWLCYSWAKQNFNTEGILIYINLRLLQFGDINSISKYISSEYLKLESIENISFMLSFINEDITFILDGFDELNSERQKLLKRDLHQISKDNKYVLLSRPYGLINNPGFNWEFSIQIDGFNNSNIYNYADKFLSINNLQYKRNELLDIISQNRVLEDYAHTPLMLSHIVYIFLESDNPELELLDISSQFHLQNLVFNWIQKYEISKKPKKDITLLINEAYKFAYEMEIQKLVLIENRQLLDESTAIAEYLSLIGLGKMQIQEINQLWRFDFNSITFQEYLSSLYLKNRITPIAFSYLASEKYFWNFTRMIIGALSFYGKENLLFEILTIHLKAFQETKQFKHWFSYVMHLSEVSSSLINKLITEQNIVNLFSTYKTAYWDQNWRAIILDATTKIYSKLDLHKKIVLKKLLIGDIKKLLVPKLNSPANDVEPTKLLITKLRLQNDNNFLQNIISLQIESIDLLLSDSTNEILEQIHEGLMFVFEEVLCESKPDNIILIRNKLEILLKKTPDVFITPRSKLLSYNISHEQLLKKLSTNFNTLEVISSESKFLKEDLAKTKTLIQDFIVNIFHLGTSHKKTSQTKEENLQLIQKYTKLAIILFKKIELEDYDLDEFGNLLINSLLNFEKFEIYDLILDTALITRPSYLIIRVVDEDKFFTYLQELVNKASTDFNKKEIDKLIMCFSIIENARNQFARIREDFLNLLCGYIDKNSEAFKNSVGGYSFKDQDKDTSTEFQKTQLFNYIINTSLFSNDIFSYDKKYLLDGFIKYSEYKYFKNWFHPMAWGRDFKIYQKKYWDLILQYTNNLEYLGPLITILRNPSIYEYSSNILYLNKILHYLLSLSEIPTKNSNLIWLIEVLSRSLVLIKSQDKIDNTSEECLELCTSICDKFRLNEIFIQGDTPRYLEGKDLLIFILLFYFLRDDKYKLNIDYDDYLNDYFKERKQLMSYLLTLFTKNEKLELDDLKIIYPVLGIKFIARLNDLINSKPELLNNFNISDFESKLDH